MEFYEVNEDLLCVGLTLRVECLTRFAWHGIQLARRPAWGRGYWLSIFMVDLKSDYIWVRSIDLMDFKRLDPINESSAPEATPPPVS